MHWDKLMLNVAATTESVLIFSDFSFVTFFEISVCKDICHKLQVEHVTADLFRGRTSRHAAPRHLPDHQSVAVDVGHDVGLEVVLVHALI